MPRTGAARRIRPYMVLAAGLLCLAAPAAPARADILYAVDAANHTIEKFTPDGVGSVFATTASIFPRGIAFDRAGNLYVATDDSTIEKFTPGGVGSIFASSGLAAPGGLAFDRAGNLYAANDQGNTIEKFTPDGIGSVFATSPTPGGGPSRLNAPYHLAFDSTGNLYVQNNGTPAIEEFTHDGVGAIFKNIYGAEGIAFDSAGNFYAAIHVNGKNWIQKFAHAAGVGSVFASNGLDYPFDLAFDSAGNLYVSNPGNATIEKITPDGVGSVFASTLGNPGGLAFTNDAGVPLLLPPSVPEPSTWALLCIALPALLVRVRQRPI